LFPEKKTSIKTGEIISAEKEIIPSEGNRLSSEGKAFPSGSKNRGSQEKRNYQKKKANKSFLIEFVKRTFAVCFHKRKIF
jgi:hypothetical protein